MKEKQFYTFLLGLLVGAIITVVFFKFIKGNEGEPGLPIDNLNTIPLYTLTNQQIRMSDIIKEDDTIMPFVSIRDCFSCIVKGIEDLKLLQKKGKDCFVIVIHDNLEEAAGWAGTIDFDSVYAIKKVAYYEHIHAKSTPVLIHFKGGAVYRYNYIYI